VVPERLGLPHIGSARPFAFALAIDAFGSGLFLPFSLLYFHHVGGLSLTQAGLGLSIAMLMAVPAPLFAGVLLDRSSPKRTFRNLDQGDRACASAVPGSRL